MNYIIGIDVGASEIKASIFDRSGREIASAGRDCLIETPHTGWAQSPPQVLTQWPLDVLRELVTKSDVRAESLDVIAVTGSRATVMAMKRDGRPLSPAILWYDRRSKIASENLKARLGDRTFHTLTGVPLDPTPSVTKMMWLRAAQPDIFAETEVFALPQTVVLHELTGGDWYCDDTYGPYFGLMDLKSRNWSEELLAAAEIPVELLPDLVPPGTVIGAVSESAARITGLRSSTQVVAAGSDAACFKLGSGVGESGTVSLHIASAGAIGVIADKPIYHPSLTCCPAAIPDRWDVDALLLTGGSAYAWLRDLFNLNQKEATRVDFVELDTLAADAPAGSDGVIVVPHLAGAGTPLWDPNACGVIFGLRLSHQVECLARAFLEGIAYAHRHALGALKGAVSSIERLQMTGGGSRSELWCQIIANVMNLPVFVPSGAQSTSLGAAITAAIATGAFPDYATAIADMTSIEKIFHPDVSAASKYDEGYQKYLSVLGQLFHTPESAHETK